MYGHLRDLCIEVLGYSPSAVDIDRSGARGRPDLTIFAPGGADNEKVVWIVVEAKDELGICRESEQRAALFAEKSKYITADTAWFVMVDPTSWVMRPTDHGSDASGDVVLDLKSVTFDQFRDASKDLRADVAGVPKLLERFRDGDERLIAVGRLSGTEDAAFETVIRNVFLDGLEETTQRLQSAAVSALGATASRRRALSEAVGKFSERYRGYEFHAYPVSIEGKPQGREEAIQHGRDVQEINRTLAADPALARLTLNALPKFAERTGINPESESSKLERFFATETANLILARILLIRFLEDYGFFDEVTPDGVVKRRYLCNGGVLAFQGMRAYFGQHYTRLLEDAYRTGAKVFSAAFKETEHDWVLDLADETLSRNIEWAMFRFARFDFTTIRGDILTGIYDRFLDAKQRKAQGEFYTPPSIARYILDRLDLAADDCVLDPCCGSGTFLIERYQQVVGEDAQRGIATYEEACQALSRIAGNDLNPFSAVLTQIQLLWHLLSFGEEVKNHGMPTIRVSERANSLVPTDLLTQVTTRFSDIDVPSYAAVVGNPPYVRPERGLGLEPIARDYYAQGATVCDRPYAGVSPNSNLYNLFIYRALDYWCSLADHEGAATQPGKLAFVVPLSFCVAKNSADLRALFALGGRWTITEIVDMELIWRHVFDADVLPMILFAEARPPTEDDVVTLRHVDDNSVKRDDSNRQSRVLFALETSPESVVRYPDLFTPEGRIATRLTPERIAIVAKLRGVGQLSQAAKRYWTKTKGGFSAVDVEPGSRGRLNWEERRMIAEGIARRNTGSAGCVQGLDVYKGENIRTGDLVGQPAFRGLDFAGLSQRSVWRFPQLLPARMWCLPIIEQIPCAASFDPKNTALTNTATVFGPRRDLEGFPFDMLLSSRIYGWFTLLSLRSSYQNMLRSHMYPSTIASLPWSEALVAIAPTLVGMREGFFADCRARQDTAAERSRRAKTLGMGTLREAFSTLTEKHEQLVYSSEFELEKTFELVTMNHGSPQGGNVTCNVTISSIGHQLTFPNETIARYARLGFELAVGCEMTRTKLLHLPVPDNDTTAHQLKALLHEVDPDQVAARVLHHVDQIDRLVGEALGLTEDEVAFIQSDMRDDPFFSCVRPRYPYFTPAQRGRRTSLESVHRYAPSGSNSGP